MVWRQDENVILGCGLSVRSCAVFVDRGGRNGLVRALGIPGHSDVSRLSVCTALSALKPNKLAEIHAINILAKAVETSKLRTALAKDFSATTRTD